MLRLPLLTTLALLTACPSAPEPRPVRESTTSPAARAGTDDPTVVAADAITTPAAGAREPLVIVTVFADLQCPYCREAPEIVGKLLRHWPDAVQVQFRQLPLEEIHPLARAGAQAVLAAHRQGGFACLEHALYASQRSWRRDDVASFRARALELGEEACGLDPLRLDRDMSDPALGRAIDADIDRAGHLAVAGTPSFLVDGLPVHPRDRATDSSLAATVRHEIAHGADRDTYLRERVIANTGKPHGADWLLDDKRP